VPSSPLPARPLGSWFSRRGGVPMAKRPAASGPHRAGLGDVLPRRAADAAISRQRCARCAVTGGAARVQSVDEARPRKSLETRATPRHARQSLARLARRPIRGRSHWQRVRASLRGRRVDRRRCMARCCSRATSGVGREIAMKLLRVSTALGRGVDSLAAVARVQGQPRASVGGSVYDLSVAPMVRPTSR